MVREILDKLASGVSISESEAEQFMEAVIASEASDAHIASFLTGLRLKGETPEEVAGCVRALRRYAIPVPHNQSLVFDCCGTGGDGSGSFNISTAAAFIVAACGVPTAKHGNRAVSSASGSADILEEAGAKIDIAPENSARLLDKIGFCFLFAPLYHPATKRVAAVRRELGFRTIFNLLGPLLNPAKATHQIVGTSSLENARKIAAVAGKVEGLNIRSIHNSCGVDEILPAGINYVVNHNEDGIDESTIAIPSALMNGFQPESIKGGDKKRNLEIMVDVFAGNPSSYAMVSALNAAFGLVCVGRAEDVAAGYDMSVNALQSGKVNSLFNRYIAATHEGG